MKLHDRGLDLSNLDITTAEEVEAFNSHYANWQGRPHIGFNFLVNNKPDALKRYQLYVHYLGTYKTPPGQTCGLIWLYSYLGFEPGIQYMIRGRQMMGFTKEQCLEAIAVAFLYSGPRGIETIAHAMKDFEWIEPKAENRQDAWAPDPQALRSGIDFSSPELSETDLEQLVAWYERMIGYVPRSVGFLAKHRPEILKAVRNRYEHCCVTLPPQFLALGLLYVHLIRQDREGIRENTLLSKALGTSQNDVMHIVANAIMYIGLEGVSLFDEVAGDVFGTLRA